MPLRSRLAQQVIRSARFAQTRSGPGNKMPDQDSALASAAQPSAGCSNQTWPWAGADGVPVFQRTVRYRQMRHLLGVSVKAVSAPKDSATPGGSLASPSTRLGNSWLLSARIRMNPGAGGAVGDTPRRTSGHGDGWKRQVLRQLEQRLHRLVGARCLGNTAARRPLRRPALGPGREAPPPQLARSRFALSGGTKLLVPNRLSCGSLVISNIRGGILGTSTPELFARESWLASRMHRRPPARSGRAKQRQRLHTRVCLV